jgi:hypothetical protein
VATFWNWLVANGLANDVVFTVVGWSVPILLAYLTGKHVLGRLEALVREHTAAAKQQAAATERLAVATEAMHASYETLARARQQGEGEVQ